jgi:hypothetical protein
MRIIHTNNVDFDIDNNGEISRRSTWHVMPDENYFVSGSWTDFRPLVEQWAGSVGDSWRLPTPDSQNYTEDSQFIVGKISFRSIARHIYEVEYSGYKKHLSAEMVGGVTESVNNSDERTKTAVWKVHADSLDNWIPAIGDVLNWAGSDFICEDIQLQKHADNEWEVKISAKDTSVMMIGQPDFSRSDDYESIRKAKWRVGIHAFEDFITAHDINSDASGWAGEAYYVSDIEVSTYGKIAYYVTLEARQVMTRLLEVKRQESFSGYDSDGNIDKVVNWTSRWRIHRDSLSDFENITGQSAEEWSTSGTIITKVEPVRVTDLIYEVTMEAEELENSGVSAASYSLDNRSKLANRKDIFCKEVDYVLTAAQCGWYEEAKGKFEKIPDWTPAKQCPFITSSNLDIEMINTKLKCVFVSEVSFLRGRSKAHVKMNLDWSRISRVESRVAGVTGSWLKKNFDTEELFDNEGKRWTKIIRSYIHAPAGFEWNTSYGEHK